ncbi:flavodoxin family protein [Chloroflexota bacterium]
MFEVVYYSLPGNTTRIAKIIADELGVQAESIKSKAELAQDSCLFLGYGGNPWSKLPEFIARNDLKGREVVLFGTSGEDADEGVREIEEMLKPIGAIIISRFYCKRRASPIFNWGHPNDEEIAGTRDFAGKIKGSHQDNPSN